VAQALSENATLRNEITVVKDENRAVKHEITLLKEALQALKEVTMPFFLGL
jgi:hypothetical protein